MIILKQMIKMKKTIWMMLAMFTACVLTAGLVSCGDDADDDSAGSVGIDVRALIGASFTRTDEYKGGSENIEKTTREITFLSQNTIQVQVFGFGYDVDGRYSWDYGQKVCTFTVSGNKIIIPYSGDNNYKETIEITFSNNMPVGWKYLGGGNLDDNDNGTGGDAVVLIGYYMDSDLMNSAKKQAEQQVKNGNTDWSYFNTMYSGGRGIRIVNGTTLYYVSNGVMVTDPSRSMSNVEVLKTEVYSIGNVKRTLYYYMSRDAQREHSYTLNGTTIVLDNGTQLTYSDGTLLTATGSEYVKLK